VLTALYAPINEKNKEVNKDSVLTVETDLFLFDDNNDDFDIF
jgi:hypothetical protein